MKVDIVLITYNQEQYIAQAVESVLMQRVNDDVQVRLMVADDCSTDKTLEIIKLYETKSPFQFVYLSAEQNMGHVRNYKRAFAACEGDYVAILEGDDYWTSPLHIKMQIEYMQNHHECVLTTTTPVFYDNTYNLEYYNNIKDFITIYSTKDFLKCNKIANLSACVIRTSVLHRIDERIFKADLLDWILYIALSEHGVLVRIKTISSLYRVNSNGCWTKMNVQEQNVHRCKILTSYDELLERKYHSEFVNTKNLLMKEKSCKNVLKAYIPPLILDLFRWLLPPIIFKKIK